MKKLTYSEIEAKLQELAELKQNLKTIEWILDDSSKCYYCPACDKLEGFGGHKKDCWIGNAIK